MIDRVRTKDPIKAEDYNKLVDAVNYLLSQEIVVDRKTMRMEKGPWGIALASLAAGGGTPMFYGKLDNNLYNSAEGVYVTPMDDMWFVTDPGTTQLFVYNIPQTIDDGSYLFHSAPDADCLCMYSSDRDKWYFVWVQCAAETPLAPPEMLQAA